MKARLYTILFFIAICAYTSGQTVIKLPFVQPQPFVVQPQMVNMQIENNEPIELGLDAEIHGGSGIYAFSWTRNNVPLSTEPIFTATSNGTYILTVKDGEGCQSSITYSVSGGVGIENLRTQTSMHIYPNPSDGIFFLTIPETHNLQKIEIYTMQGVLVLSYSNFAKQADKGRIEVDAQKLPRGHYLLTSFLGNKRVTKVLILK